MSLKNEWNKRNEKIISENENAKKKNVNVRLATKGPRTKFLRDDAISWFPLSWSLLFNPVRVTERIPITTPKATSSRQAQLRIVAHTFLLTTSLRLKTPIFWNHPLSRSCFYSCCSFSVTLPSCRYNDFFTSLSHTVSNFRKLANQHLKSFCWMQLRHKILPLDTHCVAILVAERLNVSDWGATFSYWR